MSNSTPNKDASDGDRHVLTRRTAVKLGVVGLVGMAVGASALPLARRLRPAPTAGYRFFTPEEARVLIAVTAQLIPADDTPGAAEAGAIEYIDRQLMRRFKAQQPVYRNGLAALQRTSERQYGAKFERLSTEQQIELLTRLEGGRVPKELWEQTSASGFFNVVLAHTMQSFYGSPRHGGNRDFASYRMLNLPLPQVVGRNKPARS